MITISSKVRVLVWLPIFTFGAIEFYLNGGNVPGAALVVAAIWLGILCGATGGDHDN